jgi:hypothetical protein
MIALDVVQVNAEVLHVMWQHCTVDVVCWWQLAAMCLSGCFDSWQRCACLFLVAWLCVLHATG